MQDLRPAWCELDLAALAHNTRQVRALLGPRVRLWAVCKNDAYGCGAGACAETLLANGADAFAVSDPEDAWSLRQAGVTQPILLYAATVPDQAAALADLGLIATVHDVAGLEALDALGRAAPVQVEVDCGFGRLGFLPQEWPAAFARLKASNLAVEGVYTHLGSVEDSASVAAQAARFAAARRAAAAAGLAGLSWMAASSRVLLGNPELNLDAVNPGRMLYGMMEEPWLGRIELRPVIRAVKSRVLQVKTLPDDFDVGYGPQGERRRGLRTAVIAFGFKDGLPRQPAGGAVLIRGQRAPILGLRATEHSIVDVTGIPGVAPGDEVVVVGEQGGRRIDQAEAVAAYAMPLIELLPRMARNLRRVYVG